MSVAQNDFVSNDAHGRKLSVVRPSDRGHADAGEAYQRCTREHVSHQTRDANGASPIDDSIGETMLRNDGRDCAQSKGGRTQHQRRCSRRMLASHHPYPNDRTTDRVAQRWRETDIKRS